MKNDLAIIFCIVSKTDFFSRFIVLSFHIPFPSILPSRPSHLSPVFVVPVGRKHEKLSRYRRAAWRGKIKSAPDPLDYRLIRTALSVTFSKRHEGSSEAEKIVNIGDLLDRRQIKRDGGAM